MNVYREIELASWPRRPTFEYYRHFENQLFNLTVELEAGALYRRAKDGGESFFLLTLYVLLRGVNRVPQFRQRILEGERVVEFEHLAALTPVLTPEDEFCMALTEYAETWERFREDAAPALAAARRGEFDPAVRQRNDYCCASCVPWFGFTGFAQAALSLRQSIPILTWGKMNRAGKLPLALQLNHALVDGRQVAKFLDGVNHELADPRLLAARG